MFLSPETCGEASYKKIYITVCIDPNQYVPGLDVYDMAWALRCVDEAADQGLAAQPAAQGGARASGYRRAEGLLLEQTVQLFVRDAASW